MKKEYPKSSTETKIAPELEELFNEGEHCKHPDGHCHSSSNESDSGYCDICGATF